MLDSQMKYVRAGLPVYLRVANFTDEEAGESLEIGFNFSPSGTFDTGFTDILIQPPPTVTDVSMHDIGIAGGRLNFGARYFTISNTFVLQQLQLDSFLQNNITDPYAVFRDRDGYKAMGIYYDSRMFSIDDIVHKEVAGKTIWWKLTCNALETTTTSQGGP